MNLDDILTFLAIVDCKSISKASEQLFLSQATTSQRLKALEDKLGVQLFVRHKGHKNVELTERGAMFIPIAQKWLSLNQETKMLKIVQPNHYLAIGCSDSLTTHLFSDLFQTLAVSEPDLDMKLRIKDSAQIYSMIEQKELDVGLLLHTTNNRRVRTEALTSEKMVVLQYGTDTFCKPVLTTDDLDQRKEILQWWGKQYQIWHDNQFDPSIRSNINVNTISLMMSVLKKEGTWSIVPYTVARNLQKKDRFFVYDLIPSPPKRITYKIVSLAPRPGSIEALKLFDRYLNEFIDRTDGLNRLTL
ncbi:LysR family transcriptional regulator [Anaerolentibacter hominis]|uniref:LysR family transcriptional regulator n=1 Tax=Anaerolentibacter hominis TaxID=3079009 RepID=UPI0031B8A42F